MGQSSGVAASQDDAPLPGQPSEPARSLAVENKRALIVSNAMDDCMAWQKALLAAGWTVDIVADRDQALTRIAARPPSLLLLDLGQDTTSAMVEEGFAERCRESGLAAIAVLREPTPIEVAMAFKRGVVDVLIAPFDASMLMEAVERAGSFRDRYQENLDYRHQLECANTELRDSLNILRMDQLAGRQVQQDILPREPLDCRGYRISHTIVPSLYLSGDFVGYSSAFDRYILFYFGDVSGHGASSAFVTIMLAYMLRQLRRRHVAESDFAALARAPEGLAEHVNRQILGMGIDKHMTFFAGAIDTEHNWLRYVIGGMSPAPVMIVDRVARFLPGKGKPLGLFREGHWEISECELPPGSALVVVSDGLLEQLERQPGEDLDQVLLRRLTGLAENRHETLCAALDLAEIHEAPDDASVLTVVRDA